VEAVMVLLSATRTQVHKIIFSVHSLFKICLKKQTGLPRSKTQHLKRVWAAVKSEVANTKHLQLMKMSPVIKKLLHEVIKNLQGERWMQ
jgi:hypothetical protein